jgi:hypothetical protein
VDQLRFERSTTDVFYILDTFSLFEASPIISVVGSTGNLYNIVFCPGTIKCSCPDTKTPCKHMLFLFRVLQLSPKPGVLKIQVDNCISRIIGSRPFHINRIDHRANRLCCMFLYKSCASCIKTNDGLLYVCNECDLLTHSYHLHGTRNQCPQCNCLWEPYHSPMNSGYRNFYAILSRLGYNLKNPNIAAPVHPPRKKRGPFVPPLLPSLDSHFIPDVWSADI